MNPQTSSKQKHLIALALFAAKSVGHHSSFPTAEYAQCPLEKSRNDDSISYWQRSVRIRQKHPCLERAKSMALYARNVGTRQSQSQILRSARLMTEGKNATSSHWANGCDVRAATHEPPFAIALPPLRHHRMVIAGRSGRPSRGGPEAKPESISLASQTSRWHD